MTKRPLKTNGFHVSRDLSPRLVPISSLTPLGEETRKHKARKVAKIATNLDRFGQVLPVLADKRDRVISGWAVVLAARSLGLLQLQVVTLTDIDEAQARALRLALNKLQEDSDWDSGALRMELDQIFTLDSGIDIQSTGFEIGEVDTILHPSGDDEDEFLPHIEPIVATTMPGDLWQLGEHATLCGDSLDDQSFRSVLGADRAEMIISDPPYNVSIRRHAGGKGQFKHAEFVQGSGEMSPEQYRRFLRSTVAHWVVHVNAGAICFICIDWRHTADLFAAADGLFSELKNICVWKKSNAGMGSFYRSQHEFICVFKVGNAAHINNVQLGRNGRHRSNVWEHPGQNTLSNSPKGKLALHPTVKPVALFADAIRDCSNINGIILDPFGGAGTTLIAAERTGRRARLIEIEPRFVDVTIRRWQALTGKAAIHVATGRTFDEISAASVKPKPEVGA